MLLDILQCAGQATTMKNNPVQNVSNATVEKPCINKIFRILNPERIQNNLVIQAEDNTRGKLKPYNQKNRGADRESHLVQSFFVYGN